MKLKETLEILSCNKRFMIALVKDGKTVKTFSAVSYKDAVDEYGDEVVAKIKITSPSTMAISFDDEEETGNEEPEEE